MQWESLVVRPRCAPRSARRGAKCGGAWRSRRMTTHPRSEVRRLRVRSRPASGSRIAAVEGQGSPTRKRPRPPGRPPPCRRREAHLRCSRLSAASAVRPSVDQGRPKSGAASIEEPCNRMFGCWSDLARCGEVMRCGDPVRQAEAVPWVAANPWAGLPTHSWPHSGVVRGHTGHGWSRAIALTQCTSHH